MSKVFIEESILQDIANAIRQVNNSEEEYTPAEMASAISALSVPYHIAEKTITQNGTYYAINDNVNGYSKIVVNVQPKTSVKTIRQNGIYEAETDNVDGYSKITVEIS